MPVPALILFDGVMDDDMYHFPAEFPVTGVSSLCTEM